MDDWPAEDRAEFRLAPGLYRVAAIHGGLYGEADVHIDSEAVEEVTREIASLGQIAVSTRKEIFSEFYTAALANSYLTEGGLEYAKNLLRKSLSPDDAVYRIRADAAGGAATAAVAAPG